MERIYRDTDENLHKIVALLKEAGFTDIRLWKTLWDDVTMPGWKLQASQYKARFIGYDLKAAMKTIRFLIESKKLKAA